MSKRLILASAVAVVAGAAFFGTSVAAVRDVFSPPHITETILYKFHGGDGAYPFAGLVPDATGALYGTTDNGGNEDLGTVFKLVPSRLGYTESVIYQFPSTSAGGRPQGGVILDRSGAVYGTAYSGGSSSRGVIFKLTPTSSGYVETTIHQFAGAPNDGAYPLSGLTAAQDGGFFGTTTEGGTADAGTVFEIKPSGTGYTERVLYSFQGGREDGAAPNAPVIVNAAGQLLGTTQYGGSLNCDDSCGTVFALYPHGRTYTEHVLHYFTGAQNGDGGIPYGALVASASGDLFGTTSSGGQCKSNPEGCGTVFALRPGGGHYTESILHRFIGGSDGRYPESTLTLGPYGALYGTTTRAGVQGGCPRDCGYGTVFELVPSAHGYRQTTLFSFRNRAEGAFPVATLLRDSSGALYGATIDGDREGNIFKLAR